MHVDARGTSARHSKAMPLIRRCLRVARITARVPDFHSSTTVRFNLKRAVSVRHTRENIPAVAL